MSNENSKRLDEELIKKYLQTFSIETVASHFSKTVQEVEKIEFNQTLKNSGESYVDNKYLKYKPQIDSDSLDTSPKSLESKQERQINNYDRHEIRDIRICKKVDSRFVISKKKNHELENDKKNLLGNFCFSKVSLDKLDSNHEMKQCSNQLINKKESIEYLYTKMEADLAKIFVYNSFKSLLKLKKRFIDTENIISVIICNLISDANDNYLYTNHSKYINTQTLINRNCLNLAIILACTSTGLKFKPAFMLNHIDIGEPLIENKTIEHVKNPIDWFDRVFKIEIEENMIYNCLFLTENEKLYCDYSFTEKLNLMKCEMIIIPNSLALNLSPYQNSLLFKLNGLLHSNFINSGRFPINLNELIQNFQNTWNRLTENDIMTSFHNLVNYLDE